MIITARVVTTEVCRLVVQCNRQMGVDSSNCVLAVSGQPNLIKNLGATAYLPTFKDNQLANLH